VVITGLFVAAGDFLSSQREQTVRTELGVVGQHLATELVAADRLVEASDDTNRLVANATLPETVAGAGYAVEVRAGGADQQLLLRSENPDVSVTVAVSTATPVATGAVDGGEVTITYDPGADELEVSS